MYFCIILIWAACDRNYKRAHRADPVVGRVGIHIEGLDAYVQGSR